MVSAPPMARNNHHPRSNWGVFTTSSHWKSPVKLNLLKVLKGCYFRFFDAGCKKMIQFQLSVTRPCVNWNKTQINWKIHNKCKSINQFQEESEESWQYIHLIGAGPLRSREFSVKQGEKLPRPSPRIMKHSIPESHTFLAIMAGNFCFQFGK